MPCDCPCHKPDERNWITYCDECCDGPVDYETLEAKLVSAQEALRQIVELYDDGPPLRRAAWKMRRVARAVLTAERQEEENDA